MNIIHINAKYRYIFWVGWGVCLWDLKQLLLVSKQTNPEIERLNYSLTFATADLNTAQSQDSNILIMRFLSCRCFAVNCKLEQKQGRAEEATLTSEVRKRTGERGFISAVWVFSLKRFPTAAWAAKMVPERDAGSANGHNGVKLANKRKGPVGLRLKDCSMHTNTLPVPIQEPFPRHL